MYDTKNNLSDVFHTPHFFNQHNYGLDLPRGMEKLIAIFKTLNLSSYNPDNTKTKTSSVYDSINSISSSLYKLRKEFEERVLNIENYLLDVEIHKQLGLISKLSKDFTISKYEHNKKVYHLPTICIGDEYYQIRDILAIINEANKLKENIFFLIKYKSNNTIKYYLYNHGITPIKYFINDLEEINTNSNYIVNKLDKTYDIYYQENNKTYKLSYEKSNHYVVPPFDKRIDKQKKEIEANVVQYEICNTFLTKKIFDLLDNNFKKITTTLYGYDIVVKLQKNSFNENLPTVTIKENGINVFNGNGYNDFINFINNEHQRNIYTLFELLEIIEKW